MTERVARAKRDWLLPLRRLVWKWRAREPRPRLLTIEPTNRCNLNCPFCLAGLQNTLAATDHDRMPRPFGAMDFALYERIVRDAVAFGVDTLQLHFQGEPLLHKRFADMVAVAHRAGLTTHAFTNGLLLNEELSGRIIDAGLDLLRFSVDGASQAVYVKSRVGGDFAKVYRNMAAMARLARERRSGIRLIWQCIALRDNEHELERARAMAAEIGVEFIVKTLAPTDPALAPLNPALRRQLHLKPCKDIYRAMFVYWNGDVVTCCFDQAGAHVVGNLGGQTLQELWNGRAWRRLRRRIGRSVAHPGAEPDMCKACLKWSHWPWRTSDGKTNWTPGAEGGEGAGSLPIDDE